MNDLLLERFDHDGVSGRKIGSCRITASGLPWSRLNTLIRGFRWSPIAALFFFEIVSAVGASPLSQRYGTSFSGLVTSPETVLYGFIDGGAHGAYPNGGVTPGKDGTLYGTTSEGGTFNNGVVFALTKLTTGYSYSVLHYFQGGNDGSHPNGGLTYVDGALYGTTLNGGTDNLGTVFKLTPTSSGFVESVIYSFVGGASDGENPYAGLVAGQHGALYGTTGYGGSFGSCYVADCGTVFALSPSKSAYKETILHRFAVGDGTDPFDSLVADPHGVLYGTTEGGGQNGFGTVFSIDPSAGPSSYKSLYSFFGSSDGAYPYGSLVVGKDGSLYGTTTQSTLGTRGSVFRLTPNGLSYTLTTLFTFLGGAGGGGPYTNVILRSNGQICGTTEYFGRSGAGVVFCLHAVASGFSETVMHQFIGGSTDGSQPIGNIVDSAGYLYGTTVGGWTNGEGTVYRFRL